MDQSGQDLLSRLSNKTYEQCRAGNLSLPGFPDFGPPIAALRNETTSEGSKTYRVTCQVHDRLLILESLATRWLQDENTSEDAKMVLDAHNKEYNTSGEMMTDRTHTCHVLLNVLHTVRKTFNHQLQHWLWFQISKLFVPSELKLFIAGIRTGAEDAEPQEPPAKKIKVEKITSEEVAKIPNGTLNSKPYQNIFLYVCTFCEMRSQLFWCKMSWPSRKTLQLNNTCDLLVCGDEGEHLFVTSRGTNQFFDKRELLLDCFFIYHGPTLQKHVSSNSGSVLVVVNGETALQLV